MSNSTLPFGSVESLQLYHGLLSAQSADVREGFRKPSQGICLLGEPQPQLKMLCPIFSNPNMFGNLMFTRQLSLICQQCISQKPMSLFTALMQHQIFGFQDPVCKTST